MEELKFERAFVLNLKKEVEKLVSNGGNKQLISRMVNLERQAGELNQVEKFTEQLLDSEDVRNAHLHQVFSGQPLSSSILSGFTPSPFVLKRNFLPEAEVAQIWDVVAEKKERFQSSHVGNKTAGEVIEEERVSNVLHKGELRAISESFLENITKAIEENWSRLGVTPFEMFRKELQMTLHTDGHFFTTHKDHGEGVETRLVTFVYYFHKTPKAYEGGDLLLFDTDVEKEEFSSDYTRIIPEHNMLLLFPSNYFHRVMPVKMPQNEPVKGRFTLNGWFHCFPK